MDNNNTPEARIGSLEALRLDLMEQYYDLVGFGLEPKYLQIPSTKEQHRAAEEKCRELMEHAENVAGKILAIRLKYGLQIKPKEPVKPQFNSEQLSLNGAIDALAKKTQSSNGYWLDYITDIGIDFAQKQGCLEDMRFWDFYKAEITEAIWEEMRLGGTNLETRTKKTIEARTKRSSFFERFKKRI